jgi:Putative prokaryotic signal transducing protein
MDTFVTVLTVQYPQELWIIKGRLESDGIRCFVKDELTVQSNNFYSNAVGGVKLQVLQEDAETATELLKELGYVRDEPVEPDLLSQIDAKTAALPLLKNVDVVYRIVIITLLAILIFALCLYFIFKSS